MNFPSIFLNNQKYMNILLSPDILYGKERLAIAR
jgi:hypothetical protein